jgi:hypothetical protein
MVYQRHVDVVTLYVHQTYIVPDRRMHDHRRQAIVQGTYVRWNTSYQHECGVQGVQMGWAMANTHQVYVYA